MKRSNLVLAAALMPMIWLGALGSQEKPPEIVLFDFETAADLAAWSNLDLPGEHRCRRLSRP